MQLTTFALLAALVAAPAFANPGKAYIHNLCDFDVHLWSVDADGSSDPIVVKAGESYNEAIRRPSIGGVSFKLSNDDSCADPITQLEYTITDMLWYDISNVNCNGTECPFCEYGMYMESGRDCPTRSCAPGAAPCPGAYTLYNDDWNSLACGLANDLTLYLCRDAVPEDFKATKRAAAVAAINAPKEEFGVPAHRRKTRRHGHPHWR